MQAWLHVRNSGDGVPVISRAYPETIQVMQEQPGVYRVFLPPYFENVVAVGSLASGAGMITVTPGDEQGTAGNEISVITLAPDGSFAPAVDFSLWAATAVGFIGEDEGGDEADEEADEPETK